MKLLCPSCFFPQPCKQPNLLSPTNSCAPPGPRTPAIHVQEARSCDQEPEVLGRELREGSPRRLALSGAWFREPFSPPPRRPAPRKRETRCGIAFGRPAQKAFARPGTRVWRREPPPPLRLPDVHWTIKWVRADLTVLDHILHLLKLQVGYISHSVMSYVFVNDSSQTNVPLLQACIDGDFNYSKRLLESGFDPNIRDNRGRTGLHLAAARGNVDIAQLLHKFGGDLLATDYQGNTALHLCGHVDTIQFLVSNGLKIDICNHQGATPLVLAKRRGVNKDVIRLLESLEEQEVKGFNRGAHSKLETMQTAESESAMESHSLLNPNLQQGEGVLSSFRTTWQEFVEDLGFWRVLLLLVVIALLSLGIAYYVSGVLPFVENQPELLH